MYINGENSWILYTAVWALSDITTSEQQKSKDKFWGLFTLNLWNDYGDWSRSLRASTINSVLLMIDILSRCQRSKEMQSGTRQSPSTYWMMKLDISFQLQYMRLLILWCSCEIIHASKTCINSSNLNGHMKITYNYDLRTFDSIAVCELVCIGRFHHDPVCRNYIKFCWAELS